MILGEFRKFTEHLSDDIELVYNHTSNIYKIQAMDNIDDNTICLGGDLYNEDNIMGSIRVSTFLKKKEISHDTKRKRNIIKRFMW